jgi:hypothetical protein
VKRLLAYLAGLDWLYDGSLIVWQRRTNALAGWVRRGRRPDLPGWRGALGPLARVVILGVLALVVWAIVRAIPWLMWLLTGWWIRAAWKAARQAPAEPAEDDPARAAHARQVKVLRQLLLDLMGTGSGVHLRTVLAHLQKEGQWEGRTVTDLRLDLKRLGVPVDRGVKVAGVPTWGVRRRDLQAPSPAEASEPSTEASTAA